MSKWSFFTNHAFVLSSLYQNSSTTKRELATHAGISEGSVRKIISDLKTGGYILTASEGRQVYYSLKNTRALQNRAIQDKSLGDLFKLLGFGIKTRRR